MKKELIQNLLKLNPEQYRMTYTKDCYGFLPKRSLYAHKGTCGHAALFAGSVGMAGCAVLASNACMRTGVGKMTVSTPIENTLVLQIAAPEVILNYDLQKKYSSLDCFDAVGVGPGFGTDEVALDRLKLVFDKTSKPMVIDADAITLLGKNQGLLCSVPEGSVLTPHKKELQKLIGVTKDEEEELMLTQDLASRHNLIIIIKGAYSAVVAPNRCVYFNTTGNAGMATAGSGDVLTGIILSLLAQGVDSLAAARIGACLHGLSGDYASDELFENSIIASDLVRFIPVSLKKLYMSE